MLALSCIQKIECSGSTRCLFCELQIQSISIYFLKSKTISIFNLNGDISLFQNGLKFHLLKECFSSGFLQAKKNRAAIG